MWFWYALLAAGISAISVNTNKRILKNVNPILLTWSLFALSIPLLIILSLMNGITRVNILFFIGSIGSGLVFLLSKVTDLHSIKNNALAKIYPLVIFSTIFNYILGLLIFHEVLKLSAIIGMIVVIVGVYLLNVEKAREDYFAPIKILFTEKFAILFIFAMFLSSISASFDKIGVTNTSPVNSPLTLLMENIVSTIILTFYLIKTDKGWVTQLKNKIVPLTFASFTYAFVGIFILLGFSSGPIALVSIIKRLEIVFVLGISSLFFQEKLVKHTWIAIVFLFVGVVLIKL